jgi:hypothetical protein
MTLDPFDEIFLGLILCKFSLAAAQTVTHCLGLGGAKTRSKFCRQRGGFTVLDVKRRYAGLLRDIPM